MTPPFRSILFALPFGLILWAIVIFIGYQIWEIAT